MLDVAIFTALGWERRAAAAGLLGLEPAGPATWRGRLADGATCLLFQTGIGQERARAVAAGAPPSRMFLACGCAGALVGWLRTGDVVAADGVSACDASGRVLERLPANAEVVGWATGRGLRVHRGEIVSSPAVLHTTQAKTDAGAGGALVVEMESAAIAAEARARGIPFVAVRVVLDVAAQELTPLLDVVDPVSGELDTRRAVAVLARRPLLWRAAGRLARQTRIADRRLRGMIAALAVGGSEALAGSPHATAAAD
jgi:adenosylhomocysteine nucleosidase